MRLQVSCRFSGEDEEGCVGDHPVFGSEPVWVGFVVAKQNFAYFNVNQRERLHRPKRFADLVRRWDEHNQSSTACQRFHRLLHV